MFKKSMILLFIIVITILTACGETTSNTDNTNTEILTIYTTVYPIQYIVERIAEDNVQSETIYPPGTDEHSYEPTAKKMTEIANADAFIYMGDNLEVFAETTANALLSESVKQIKLAANEQLFTPLESDEEHSSDEEHHHNEPNDQHEGHSHGDHDPHIWIDPIRMVEMASIIKDELVELKPDQEELFNTNFDKLKSDLLALDEEYQQVLNNKQSKKILVSHAAYGYWEQRYGIEQIAVNGISSSSEPSQQDLVHIIEQAKQHNINYMIFEQNVSNKVSKQIQSEIGASTAKLHNLAVLTDEDINNKEDYLSIMKNNLKVLDQVTN